MKIWRPSDAALVSAAITGASLCSTCIAKRTGVPAARVDAILGTITGTIQLVDESSRCEACLAMGRTFRLDGGGPAFESVPSRNGHEKTRSLTRDVIVRFLEERRGDVFCADCITKHLFGGKNIDVAMRHLEGNGLRRHHGRCSACEKSRLVSGL